MKGGETDPFLLNDRDESAPDLVGIGVREHGRRRVPGIVGLLRGAHVSHQPTVLDMPRKKAQLACQNSHLRAARGGIECIRGGSPRNSSPAG